MSEKMHDNLWEKCKISIFQVSKMSKIFSGSKIWERNI